jgi:RNA polymerase sigma-70 factor, ECF subfamily
MVAITGITERVRGSVTRSSMTPGFGGAEGRANQRQAQFQLLVDRTRKQVYRFALHSVRNSQDAEDVVQEALARAWSHFDTYDPRRSFEGWIYRIISNLIIDRSRRRSRRQEVSLDAPAACIAGNEGMCCAELSDRTGDPQDCLMAKEISAELQSAWRSLPPLHQEVLALVAQQHSYEQIARAFDCPMGTVRSRVHRARVMLRRNMKARISQ